MGDNVITYQDFTPATVTACHTVVCLDGLVTSITLASTVPFHPVVCHRLKYYTHGLSVSAGFFYSEFSPCNFQ